MKKLISIGTIIIIISSLLVTSVSASALVNKEEIVSEEFVMCGDSGSEKILSLDEQIEEIVKSKNITDNKKSQAIAKINFSKQVNEEQTKNGIKAVASNTYNCTRLIPYYKQLNEYYCGPATTKQSLQYLKGSSPSQSEIANSLGTTTSGTDGTRIVSYLNANQSSNYYVAVTPSSQSAMENMIYSGLTNYNAPPILRVKITSEQVSSQHPQSWYYTTNGHFMNVSGQYTSSGSTYYQVTDPYIEYKAAISSGRYRISASAVYTSTMQHFAQHFYY